MSEIGMSDDIAASTKPPIERPRGKGLIPNRTVAGRTLAAAAAGGLWALAYFSVLPIAEWLAEDLMGLSRGSRMAEAVTFFLYDVPKILLLLTAMVFIITFLRTFVGAERARSLLASRRAGVGNGMAARVGVVTPFCSCSAVPLFIGFIEAGVPLGVTFSYLIAAPLVNEVAIVLLIGLFGWKIAALYVVSGLVIATLSGAIIGRLRLERYVEDFVWQVHVGRPGEQTRFEYRDRLRVASASTREIVGKVLPYLVVGIGFGAAIHGYVPERALTDLLGNGSWWSVPAAVVFGVPLYSNAAGILPVVQALIGKGVALGVALAFMMAVVGLSFPELVILRRVLKLPLIAAFVAILTGAILITGYLFILVL